MKPPFRPLGPAPQYSASSTAIRTEGSRSSSASAVQRPVYPPPTIATSTSASPWSGGASARAPSAARASSIHHGGGCPGSTVGCISAEPPTRRGRAARATRPARGPRRRRRSRGRGPPRTGRRRRSRRACNDDGDCDHAEALGPRPGVVADRESRQPQPPRSERDARAAARLPDQGGQAARCVSALEEQQDPGVDEEVNEDVAMLPVRQGSREGSAAPIAASTMANTSTSSGRFVTARK